jgi:hypothetical protein
VCRDKYNSANIQSVGMFQYKIFSQLGYFSTKYSGSRNISVIFSQQGYFSTPYSGSRTILGQNISVKEGIEGRKLWRLSFLPPFLP